MHTDMILIDLQKRCSTLGHKIILEKITCLGFKTTLIKWFESYLSNRNFFVSEDVFAGGRILNCRVPQGSILGSLPFLIFINDLPTTLSRLFYLF